MDLELAGKRALITGSYRGTGLIIAAHLAREGATVYVHGFTRQQADAALDELGTGHAVYGDITTDPGAAEVCHQLADQTVDILVNNYGTADPGSWESAATQPWLDAYQKNVLSAQRMTTALLAGMRERGWGRIINIGTVGSTEPNARNPQYYAAKGALATMTVSLAKETAHTGVRVNLVSPGLILTPEVRDHLSARAQRKGWGEQWDEIEAAAAADIPIGRITRREEVADLVAFLASPLADAIHGQNIKIDGGALGIVT